MVKAYGHQLEAKIKLRSIYMLQDGSIGKIVLINRKDNRVDIKIYKNGEIQTLEFDTCQFYLKPLFSISEVASMLNKMPDTLRKYERLGIIPKCPQYKLGKRTVRLYSMSDIMTAAEALAQRKPVGRPPSGRAINISKINQKDLVNGILKRYRRIND